MKKNYVSVEADVILLASKDIITTSITVYDPENILNDNDNNKDVWEW